MGAVRVRHCNLACQDSRNLKMSRASVLGHSYLILATVICRHQTTDHVGDAVTERRFRAFTSDIDSTVCQGTDHGTVSYVLYCNRQESRLQCLEYLKRKQRVN